MQKAMNAIRVAFKILEGGDKVPPGYQFAPCKMVFDIKMEDLRRKSQCVAQGCATEAPATVMHASVVSRESVHIALTIAALNGLEVKTGDIQNAHLTAPNAEKTWTLCGPEFGADRGKKALIVRAMCGHKSAGAAFRNHLAECMRALECKLCLEDQDLWCKATTQPDDGTQHHSCVLLCVDDVQSSNNSSDTGGNGNNTSNDNTAMLHPKKLDDVKFVAGDAKNSSIFPSTPGSGGLPCLHEWQVWQSQARHGNSIEKGRSTNV